MARERLSENVKKLERKQRGWVKKGLDDENNNIKSAGVQTSFNFMTLLFVPVYYSCNRIRRGLLFFFNYGNNINVRFKYFNYILVL